MRFPLFLCLLVLCQANGINLQELHAQPNFPIDKSSTEFDQVRLKLAAGQTVTVVCLGDSVTGIYYHTGSRRAYTDMLGMAIRRAIPQADLRMVNAGISGNTTANGLDRMERDVLNHRPDIVTIMFGLNDMTRVPLDNYKRNLHHIIEKCRAAGSAVLLATPNNVIDTPTRPTAKLQEYCAAMRTVGSEANVPVCDAYQSFDDLRRSNEINWRLLMSDEIHPNLDGHRVIAELFTKSITGIQVSLAGVHVPEFSLERLRKLAASGKSLRILAMTSMMQPFQALLSEQLANSKIEITEWPVSGLTLAQLEQDAKARVRSFKPDLVVIAVPDNVIDSASEQEFIHAFAWIMNWSLNFGTPTWDCIVVHPAVMRPQLLRAPRDELIRRLVRAQDLPLVDRQDGNQEASGQLIRNWMVAGTTPQKSSLK